MKEKKVVSCGMGKGKKEELSSRGMNAKQRFLPHFDANFVLNVLNSGRYLKAVNTVAAD